MTNAGIDHFFYVFFGSIFVAGVTLFGLGFAGMFDNEYPQPALIGVRYSLMAVMPGGLDAGIDADCTAILLRDDEELVLLNNLCGTPLVGHPFNGVKVTPLEDTP